jgi:hypothetical protein
LPLAGASDRPGTFTRIVRGSTTFTAIVLHGFPPQLVWIADDEPTFDSAFTPLIT